MTSKKIFAVVLVLGLCFCGCAFFKAVGSTIGTIVKTAQDVVCDPTPGQKDTATFIKNAIANGVVFGLPLVVKVSSGVEVTVTADQVVSVLNEIQAGICAGILDLEAALGWYDQTVNAATEAAKSKGMKAMSVPSSGPLWQMLYKAQAKQMRK